MAAFYLGKRYVYGTEACCCRQAKIKGKWLRVYCEMHAPAVLGNNQIVEVRTD